MLETILFQNRLGLIGAGQGTLVAFRDPATSWHATSCIQKIALRNATSISHPGLIWQVLESQTISQEKSPILWMRLFSWCE